MGWTASSLMKMPGPWRKIAGDLQATGMYGSGGLSGRGPAVSLLGRCGKAGQRALWHCDGELPGMGRYDDHHRPMDGVLNAQGSMMDALAKLRDLGDGLAERYREGWDEHREGIQERRDEFREEFQERLEEHREGRRPSAQN